MAKELKEGDPAPDFTLPRDGGGEVSLKSFAGGALVVYFYPRDDTPGCTVEAIEFTALAKDFKKAGATVVGVSKDTVAKHDKFIAKHDLNVILGSDEDTEMIQRYGSWVEKSMYGKKDMGIDRSTFLIDGNGIIRGIWRKVKVKGHAAAVLEAAQAL